MQLQNKLFVAGEFVEAEARGRIEVFNPHDNSKIADVAEARQADIDKAVRGRRPRHFPPGAALRRPIAGGCC